MKQGFEAFFEANYPDVVRTLTLALSSRSRAEEAAQEGFAAALGRWRRVSEMDRPAAWVYVVALRWGWRLPNGPEEPKWAGSRSGADSDETVVDQIVLADAMATLSPRQRLAVVLRFGSDMTVMEIAQVMGCAQGTVKATLHQALAKLRVHLAEEQLSEEVVHGS